MNKEEAISFINILVNEYAGRHIQDALDNSVEEISKKVNFYIEFKKYIKENLK